MARPVDSLSNKQKKEDEEWLASLALIREITRQEKEEEDDRILAARMAGVEIERPPDDQRRLAMLLDDRDDDEDDKEDRRATASSTRNDRFRFLVSTVNRPVVTNTPPAKPKKCASCLDAVSPFEASVPCGHFYHATCLKELFMAAVQDESLMPPRCCGQKIPIHFPRMTLTEKQTFEEKLLEYSTVDRLYCSRPTCSTFIPPQTIVNSIGTCPKLTCRTQTCSMCKAASHGNLDCPKDTATAAVLDVAKQEGWTRCYRCRVLVELVQGCYHMTCRCRAEFCYLCSQPWKNCPCVQWDEQRLLAEAQLRTARMNEHAAPQAFNRNQIFQQVQRVANELRENEECRHSGRWICIRGAGRCEECHHFLDQYLFRCARCQMMACNRCRRNRL